mgnify:CR=1 FL=1
MFHSKSPIVKYVGYVIIGFFGLIITVSFGMPDFMSRLGMDRSTVAVINGEKIHRFDYIEYKQRYRRQFGNLPAKFEKYIIDGFIRDRLKLQHIKNLGYDATEERIARIIRNHKYFHNKKTKQFDIKILKNYLDSSRTNILDFKKMIKNDNTQMDYNYFFRMGIAVPEDDIHFDNIIKNSKIQIKIAFLNKIDLKLRYKSKVSISDDEIKQEMLKNKHKIKDPKSDKIRIKKKLEKKKLLSIQSKLIKDVDAIAKNKGTFDQANAILKGKVIISRSFKIGGSVMGSKKKRPKTYTALGNSPIFRESLLKLKNNKTSRVITVPTGYYIFTPIKKSINVKKPKEPSAEKIAKNTEKQIMRDLSKKILDKLIENSKIIKNIKTN